MKYQHLFTFRWERLSQSPPLIEAWASVVGNSESPVLPAESLRLAIEKVRNEKADELDCHPGQIVVFLVNHTVVTL